MKALLLVLGLCFEVVGIVLVASSELVPLAKRTAGAAARAAEHARLSLHKLLRRRRGVVVHVPAGGAIASGGSVSLMTSVDEDASLERKVDYLLGEAKRTQERLNAIERKLSEHPARWRRELEQVRRSLEPLIEQRVIESRDAYMSARLIGIACLLIGTALVNTASLV